MARWPRVLIGGRIARLTTVKSGGMRPINEERVLVIDVELDGRFKNAAIVVPIDAVSIFSPTMSFDPEFVESVEPKTSVLDQIVDGCEEEQLAMPNIIDDETAEIVSRWKRICTRAHTGKLAPPPMTVMCHGCTILMARDIVNAKVKEDHESEE